MSQDDNSQSQKPSKTDTLENALPPTDKHYPFVLAIIVIIGFLVFYGLTLINSTNDYSGLEKVSSTLGPIVAAIIGYYFGQRPIQDISQQAQQTKALYNNAQSEDINTLDEMQKKYEDQIEKIKDLKGTL